MSNNKRVDEARETILRACCGECGRMTPPDENVHGCSGVPFFLCGTCWDNGVRFEAKMAELGWVPKDTAREQETRPRVSKRETSTEEVGNFITDAANPFDPS